MMLEKRRVSPETSEIFRVQSITGMFLGYILSHTTDKISYIKKQVTEHETEFYVFNWIIPTPLFQNEC